MLYFLNFETSNNTLSSAIELALLSLVLHCCKLFEMICILALVGQSESKGEWSWDNGSGDWCRNYSMIGRHWDQAAQDTILYQSLSHQSIDTGSKIFSKIYSGLESGVESGVDPPASRDWSYEPSHLSTNEKCWSFSSWGSNHNSLKMRSLWLPPVSQDNAWIFYVFSLRNPHW